MPFTTRVDALQMSEALTGELSPFTERRHLSPSHRRPGDGLLALPALREPVDESCAAIWLVSVGAKKIFRRSVYPGSERSPRGFAELRFSRSMMSSAPRGAVPTRIIRWKIGRRSRAICCHHTAQRDAEDVVRPDTEAIQERQGMRGHVGDRVR